MASTTTTSSSSIDPTLQPYLTAGLDRAKSLFMTGPGPQYYQGQTYASPDAYTTQAIQQQAQRAINGNPLNQQAQNYVGNFLSGGQQSPAMSFYQNTMNGQYGSGSPMSQMQQIANGSMLNSNPYMDQMFNAASGAVKAGVNSSFEGAGRTGSGAHAAAMTQQLGNMAANMYGSNYAQERQNQLNAQGALANAQMAGAQGAQGAFNNQNSMGMYAANMAPQLAANDYNDISRLAASGAANEQIAQQGITADMNKWNYNQQLPYGQLSGYLSSVYGTPMGQIGTTTQNYSSNNIAGGLAGGLGGYMLGNALGGYGTTGAVLGGLAGLGGLLG